MPRGVVNSLDMIRNCMSDTSYRCACGYLKGYSNEYTSCRLRDNINRYIENYASLDCPLISAEAVEKFIEQLNNQNNINKSDKQMEVKFKAGQTVHVINQAELPDGKYYFGGAGFDGQFAVVEEVDYYVSCRNCYKIIVRFGGSRYNMLEDEFMEYNPDYTPPKPLEPSVKLENRLLSDSLKNKLFFIDCEVSAKLLEANRESYDKTSIRNITTRGEYDATLSFLPKNKDCHLSDDHTHWKRDNRQEGKPGKVVKNFLPKDVVPKSVEEFVNKLKAAYSYGEFDIVFGDDIREWYDGDNYSDINTGTLSGSCMRHSGCQSYFGVYTDNSNVAMVILKDKDQKLIGRAILWTTDCGIKLMDRIYGCDKTIEVFKGYAKANNFWHKEKQSYEHPKDWIKPDGSKVKKVFDISLKYTCFEDYPYADTFFSLDKDGGYVTNSPNGHPTMRDTDGDLCGSGGFECERCGCLYDEDDLIYYNDRYYCDACTEYCQDVGERRPSTEVTWLEWNQYYVSDDYENVYTCDYSHKSFDTEDAEYYYVEDKGVYVLDYYIISWCERNEYRLNEDSEVVPLEED